MSNTASSRRPGLLTRLGVLIIANALVAFGGICLIMFGPQGELASLPQQEAAELAFKQWSEDVAAAAAEVARTDVDPGQWSDMWSEDGATAFATESGLTPTSIQVQVRRDGQWLSYRLPLTIASLQGQPGQPDPAAVLDVHSSVGPQSFEFSRVIPLDDSTRLQVAASQPHGMLILSSHRTYYRVLLAALASILIALLTVHLIYHRLRDPLRRLQLGLDKTAEGEVFYQVEPRGEAEFVSIAESFNKMSRALWNDHKKVKQYNDLLQDAYLSNLESQAFMATLIDSSPCCVITTTIAGEIVIFNRKAMETFGYVHESPLGKSIDEFFSQSVLKAKEPFLNHETVDGAEVTCLRADGAQFPAYMVVSPIYDGDGNVSAYLFILLDISESKSFQEMMIEVDRYSTRGEMAGDIAHEINNYLAVLSGNIELMPLFMKRQQTEKIEQKLELMKETVGRIARFTDGLMDVNQGEAQFEPIDLNQLIQNLLAFLKPQNRFDDIEFETVLERDLPAAEVDGGQIQQLLVNLIHNAGDALLDTTPRRIVVRSFVVKVDDYQAVRLEVHDNGPGVPEDRAHSLFKERFTTKRKGHGYGLVTCRKIVDGHGGRLGYRFEDGAVFYVDLPLAQRQTEETESEGPQGSAVQPTA